jgi:CRP-like cAMP-binding protein
MPTTTTPLPDEARALLVITEERLAELFGVHPNTMANIRRSGDGPPVIALSPGRIGYRLTDAAQWLEQRARESSRLTPEVRTAAQRKLARFIDAMSKGDHAEADAIIPVTAANADVIEACGLVIRAVRASGRGAELWAQLREQITQVTD